MEFNLNQTQSNLNTPQRILVVAGEASGDEHAAELIAELKKRHPEFEFFGMGGSKLKAAGLDQVVDAEKSAAVMGITELWGGLTQVISAFKRIQRAVRERRPDLAILVDFPDFNLRLAKFLKREGVKIFYYVGPQVWAWRKSRVKTIRKRIDMLAVILPFEEAFFSQHGIPTTYVGHPLVDHRVKISRDEFIRNNQLPLAANYIALLPGSRKSEVRNLLKVMLEAFDRLSTARPGLQALIPVAAGLDYASLEKLVRGHPHVSLVREQARECLTYAEAALVASGTATLQAALCKTPCAVIYKLSNLSYFLARLLIRGVKHFSLVNLVAGRKLVTELLQDQVTPERLHLELESILGNPEHAAKMRQGLDLVSQRLQGNPQDGASTALRAARLAEQVLFAKPSS